MSLKHKRMCKIFMSKSKLQTGDYKDPYTYIKLQKANKHTEEGTFYLSKKLHNKQTTAHLINDFNKELIASY